MPLGITLSSYQAVLFDVDGTLVDSVHGLVRGLYDTYETFGYRTFTHKEIRATIGIPLHEQMKIAMGPGASEERIREGIDYAIERYAIHQSECKLFEPAVEALRLVHESGKKTALVTSKNAREVEGFLPKFAARSSVQCIVCASDVQFPKPSPESALLACRQLGVAPADSVMIGDSIYDLRCAKAAGMAAVAVSYGSTSKEALWNEQPDALFETPEALLDWVQTTIFLPHEKENRDFVERTG